jgi:outer membrane lipoprotein carrier protein
MEMTLSRAARRLWLGLLPFAALSLGVAESPPERKADALLVRRLVKSFEDRYRSARTLEATFLERYTENGQTVRSEAGTAYFQRPGKMRWDYDAPEKDLFLVDGKDAWFYVPSDHTVTRVPAKQSADWRTPLALLAGEMKVSRVCKSVELAAGEKAENEANVVLRCHVRGAEGRGDSALQDHYDSEVPDSPRGEKGVVFFEIVPETGELARLLVRQSAGVEVKFRFQNWRMNPPVPDSLFRFDVPVGVAIVNGELPGSDAAVK